MHWAGKQAGCSAGDAHLTLKVAVNFISLSLTSLGKVCCEIQCSSTCNEISLRFGTVSDSECMRKLLLEVVVTVVCRCGSHVAMGPTLQGGTKGTAAWPETPKQASNMLGGNLTPADRHGSVQVIPLPRASLPTLYSCCLLPPTLAAGGKAYIQGEVFLTVLRKFFPSEYSQFPGGWMGVSLPS